eukprot:6470791-Amphidinium_carterae.1
MCYRVQQRWRNTTLHTSPTVAGAETVFQQKRNHSRAPSKRARRSPSSQFGLPCPRASRGCEAIDRAVYV